MAVLIDSTISWHKAIVDSIEANEFRSGVAPAEMQAFLEACGELGVEHIIESGRGQFGYSTCVLGELAKRTGIRVTSIDWHDSMWKKVPECVEPYRKWVEILVGDSRHILPQLADSWDKPCALLIDGPKGDVATDLILKCVNRSPQLRLVGQHGTSDSFVAAFPWMQQEGHLVMARLDR